ncbi:MAG: long-chain fatty acid--CoA ligase [Planctomycetes bacterium]|nr:long-chain fatty acid--CoA ligase [Planctomycetota bacterium]
MPPAETLTARLFAALDRHATRPLLVTPGRDGSDRVTTAGEVRDEATRLARALEAHGVRAGEPVLLWSENRERWLVAQLALLLLGAPAIPRGAEAPPDEIAWIVDKVRARVALVERPDLLRRLATTPHHVATAILLSGAPPPPAAGAPATTLTFESCLAAAPADAPAATWRAARLQERIPTETAAIVFTSGTTGRPKGVVLTQANLAANLAQVLAIIDWLPVGAASLSILPPWHMFEQMVEYALIELGVQVVYSDRRHFARDLARFRPTVLGAVPRLWLALEEGVRAKLATAAPRKRRLVEWALERGIARARGRRLGANAPGGTPAPGLLGAPLDWLLRRLLLAKIARAMGVDRLAHGLPISGGGSLPEHVDSFFAALGVPLLNGYGLTETAPVLALRRPGHRRGGTVGPPVAHTEIAIRDPETRAPLPVGRRGVIHARGPQVMQGYFEDPAATARVLAADGWFDTGDLGHLDAHGELAITGRAKDTIVLLSGENVEPEPIENALMASPRIATAVVVGQDRKFLAALLVPRLEPGAIAPPRAQLEAAMRAEIDARIRADRGFRPNERIARFAVLATPFTVESGLLSQTLKVKRAVVAERFRTEIEQLFADPGDG